VVEPLLKENTSLYCRLSRAAKIDRNRVSPSICGEMPSRPLIVPVRVSRDEYAGRHAIKTTNAEN